MRVLDPFVVISAFIFCSMSITQAESNFLRLNANRVSIYDYEDYWILSLPCIASTGTCSTEFILVPFGWVKQTQQLKIPSNNLEKAHKYEIIAMISDEEGRKKELSIFVTYRQKLIEVKAKYQFLEDNDFDIAVLNLQRQQQKKQNNSQFLPKDDHQLSWLQRNDIAHYIPSISRIDRLIASADTYEMSKVFQNILSDKSACHKKIDYLNQLTNRVDQHITYSRNVLENEQQKVESAELKVEHLQQQRRTIQKQLDQAAKISKRTLRNQEIQLERKKVVYFSKHYSLSIVANKYRRKLNAFMANSAVNDTELQKVKEEIKSDQKELKEINFKISEFLELQSILERKISVNQKKVSDTGNIGFISSNKIAALQKKHKQYHDLAMNYEKKSREVQQQLKKVKDQLSKAQKNTNYFEEKLENIEEQLRDNKRILESEEIQKLQESIKILQRNQPRLQQKTQRCSTNVEEQERLEVQEAQNKKLIFIPQAQEPFNLAYRIPPKTFFSHLQANLQKVNIFSSAWILKYGVPSTSLFSCKFNDKMDSGYGVIIAMDKGQIRVQEENGRVMTLYLGVCTTIRGMRKTFVPVPGDIIEWQGEKVVTSIINVHRADIYRV